MNARHRFGKRCAPQNLDGAGGAFTKADLCTRVVVAAAVFTLGFAVVAYGEGDPDGSVAAQSQPKHDSAGDIEWLDQTQERVHGLVWRTARSIDGWMGPPIDDEVYKEASGRLSLAMLWDEFHGFDPKVRFRVKLPLPHVDKRMNLFIGRVNRDEFVTERDELSGVFPRRRGGMLEEDETLAGIAYNRRSSDGGDFGASGGVRLRASNLDPYVKASYRYGWKVGEDALLSVRETVFYQVSERFGLTSRVDLEYGWGEYWVMGWSASATVSEARDGVRGFAMVTATRALSDRRAISLRLELDADTEVDVPLQEFGFRAAYRKCIYKDWLALELQTSLTWPKDDRGAARKASWGVGIGLEMTFGSEPFSFHPVTF